MKLYEEGIPVSIDYAGTRYYGVTLPPVDNTSRIYYKSESGRLCYFPDSWEKDASVRQNGKAFEYVKLHAKIIDIEASSAILGQKQRKEEFKGSVLPVVAFETNPELNLNILTLRTSRIDGVYIKMLYKDLRFVYPIIYSNHIASTVTFKGEKVICIKGDDAKTYSPGEEFTVTSIVRSGHNSDYDVIVARNLKKEIAGYAKHFKIKK